MKASLQLKLGQQLTMTPQLQQAIRLLQLSTLDLQQEIQEALDSNPMLELTEDGQDDKSEKLNGKDNNEDHHDDKSEAKTEKHESELEEWSEGNDIPNDLPVDTAWDDIYPTNTPVGSGSDDEDHDFESRNSTSETLFDHLMWQLNLTPMSERDNYIAMSIIDSISHDGYLTTSIEDLHEGLFNENDEDPVELDEVQAVLKRIQHFDPPGVAARDLPECLLLQLRQLPEDTPWLPQAKLVISHYLHLLGNRDYAQLMRRSRLKEPELKQVIQLIQSLNPRPGESVVSNEPEYVVPDVIVKKENGRWKVELNPEIAPKIRVN
ncbi:MAG: RNA polymerase factor sigma-54, partial [Oleiphilaceae bacterium]|nr:RNA polymerase factor sigma-54 [Oleiphilaceae bacterium]